MSWILSIVLSLIMMLGLFLMLWSAVGFIQNKKLFTSAPKDIQEVIVEKKERFKGQHIVGYFILTLSIILLIGSPIYGLIDGVINHFSYWMFFYRFLILFVGLKLFDMTFFDIYLFCYSNFFPRYYPECKDLVGPRQLGFNIKSQIIKLLLYIAISFGLAGLAILINF